MMKDGWNKINDLCGKCNAPITYEGSLKEFSTTMTAKPLEIVCRCGAINNLFIATSHKLKFEKEDTNGCNKD